MPPTATPRSGERSPATEIGALGGRRDVLPLPGLLSGECCCERCAPGAPGVPAPPAAAVREERPRSSPPRGILVCSVFAAGRRGERGCERSSPCRPEPGATPLGERPPFSPLRGATVRRGSAAGAGSSPPLERRCCSAAESGERSCVRPRPPVGGRSNSPRDEDGAESGARIWMPGCVVARPGAGACPASELRGAAKALACAAAADCGGAAARGIVQRC